MSRVSRSVYQKVAEENKRLKNDLKTLIMDIHTDRGYETYIRLRTQFLEEEREHTALKEIISTIIK